MRILNLHCTLVFASDSAVHCKQLVMRSTSMTFEECSISNRPEVPLNAITNDAKLKLKSLTFVANMVSTKL